MHYNYHYKILAYANRCKRGIQFNITERINLGFIVLLYRYPSNKLIKIVARSDLNNKNYRNKLIVDQLQPPRSYTD
jgi:hypothetical protein